MLDARRSQASRFSPPRGEIVELPQYGAVHNENETATASKRGVDRERAGTQKPRTRVSDLPRCTELQRTPSPGIASVAAVSCQTSSVSRVHLAGGADARSSN